jgi:Leucine-rich repeat (LRR) protein
MYLSSKSYERKYLKYKNKYKILKSHIGGTLLNGGDCDPLPNPEEEELLTTQNLLDLCSEERITIQNKCYEVRSLYRWIITDNKSILPGIQTDITVEEKQRLIQAYEVLPKIQNILTRDKLIKIYPNLLQISDIDLINKGYTDIALGTFGNNLPYLQNLNLNGNKIQKLSSGIFNNLPALKRLNLGNNQIEELQPGVFNNLPNLQHLYLDSNQIQELQPGIFNNLSELKQLYLSNNQISVLNPGTFNNLLLLKELWLHNNKIQELQPDTFNNLPNLEYLSLGNNQITQLQPGIFNNLLKLNWLFLHNNQIRELQPGIFNLPGLKRLALSSNQIRELQPGIFNNLLSLQELWLNNNQIIELQRKSYYGLSTHVQLDIYMYN